MKRYGDPYISDNSPLEFNWDKSCVLRHLPTCDEVHYRWSDVEAPEMVAVSYIPGFKDDYILKTPQIALNQEEDKLITRKIGREMFNYLVRDMGWVVMK